jgi:VIT family
MKSLLNGARRNGTCRGTSAGRSQQARLGHYLPDRVYGANDGIITTFAVVSGVVGADLSRTIILILGLRESVRRRNFNGASNYLARRSTAIASTVMIGGVPVRICSVGTDDLLEIRVWRRMNRPMQKSVLRRGQSLGA